MPWMSGARKLFYVLPCRNAGLYLPSEALSSQWSWKQSCQFITSAYIHGLRHSCNQVSMMNTVNTMNSKNIRKHASSRAFFTHCLVGITHLSKFAQPVHSLRSPWEASVLWHANWLLKSMMVHHHQSLPAKSTSVAGCNRCRTRSTLSRRRSNSHRWCLHHPVPWWCWATKPSSSARLQALPLIKIAIMY